MPSYSRSVFNSDFNNITASEEPQLSVHSMGDSTFTMTDGLVAHMPIIMLNKQVFLWDAPPLGGQDTQGNDVLVMPTGRGWEAWTDDVWRIFGVVQPRPGALWRACRRGDDHATAQERDSSDGC